MGAATDVGRVRDGNEDAYLVNDEMGLIAVADGMGGHRGGEIASSIAIDTLRDAFDRQAFEEGRVQADGAVPRRAPQATMSGNHVGKTMPPY